ncbi:MAG: hypothetical protein JG777_3192 [Clostridia bacterium]|nr:hypothetical protein [Clostridia bacterium]
MTRLIKLFLIILLLIYFTACTAYSSLNIPQITEFKKNITSEYEEINSLKVQYSVSCLSFIYSFKKEISEKQMFHIFYKTKELILKEDFQEEFFKQFFKKYYNNTGEQKIYPNVSITFYLQNDEKDIYQFESLYYKEPYNSARENEIDGYKTWTYWNFNENRGKPVPKQGICE